MLEQATYLYLLFTIFLLIQVSKIHEPPSIIVIGKRVSKEKGEKKIFPLTVKNKLESRKRETRRRKGNAVSVMKMKTLTTDESLPLGRHITAGFKLSPLIDWVIHHPG